jgi:dolichyl-phosphate-mannose-protein mannosyltransferase
MATTEIGPVTETLERRRPPSLREWLAPAIPGDPALAWIGPLIVTVFAAFLRFDRLAIPNAVVFDETYYAKDALALLKFGYEHKTVEEANRLLIQEGPKAADSRIWAEGASFVAHPPAGKWMIAIGEWIFGATPFGWRFMAALMGSLSVLILCRVARRMTGSTLLGCAAGLLLAVDGLHLVTSRTALLDIFLMFWILAGFGCLVADRDHSRRVLAAKLQRGADGGFGPFVFHGWRILAGLCLGLACATKWTGIFYVAAFGIMVLLWDMGARRAAGVQHAYGGAFLLDAVPAFVSLVGISAITYLVSWWGWIFNAGGWGRGKVASNVLMRPFEAMPDLWSYHKAVWNFHTSLQDKHPYQSWPWDWPILSRPVAFFYTEPAQGCGADKCSREILGIGTPAIWWAALGALVVLAFIWIHWRDWRAGAILLGYLTGWLPWFYYALDKRTMFLFYATPMLPFMVLAIVMCLGLLIGPARDAGTRRVVGTAAAGAYMLVVLANFLYMYPVLTAKFIPWESWRGHMWFDSWI